MGLSGRKVKQRIGADPRNLSWADDAARFGQNYLSKFGWDASKGLGAEGDGMKSHIKVSHKLDMLGIGAAQTKDPNGIAWKQNRDFENLLERLNKTLAEEAGAATSGGDDDNEDAVGSGKEEDGEGKKKKKRKHDGEEESESKEKKKSKKSKKSDKEENEKTVTVVSESVKVEEVVEVKKTVVVPRHRAHRARAIAAKNISSKSAAHVSEILGFAPESSSSSSTPPVVAEPSAGKLTSVTDTDALGMDKITTSTKSLADYFKEKLNARLGVSADSGASTPSSSSRLADEEEDRPRGGIGASRMLLEIKTETRVEEETQRVGLSKFSSLMSSQFLAAASSMSAYVPVVDQDVEMKEPETAARISEVESSDSSEEEEEEEVKPKKKEKKDKKEKKEKKHKHKATKEDEEQDEEEQEVKPKKEKKSKKEKKDKKGKSKAKDDDAEEEEVQQEEEAPAVELDDKARRKLEKKAKKEKKAKLEAAVEDEDDKAQEQDEEGEGEASARKKEKRKHKSSEPSAESSEKSERKKEKEKKKERRKSSSGDS